MMENETENLHRFYCLKCGRESFYTEQEYQTALFPLDRLKCVCGEVLCHERREVSKKPAKFVLHDSHHFNAPGDIIARR